MRHVSASQYLIHQYALKPSRLAISSVHRYFGTRRSGSLDSLDSLLQGCARVQQCEQVHAKFIVSGSNSSAFLASRLVSTYARFGRLSDAQMAFDSQSQLDCFSNQILWNSILRASVSGERYENALNLYARMRKFGNLGDGYTFPLVIRACRQLGGNGRKSSRLSQVVHCHAIEAGFHSHLQVSNELIAMYAKLGRMVDARKVFEGMGVRTTLSWNMMVSGYSFNCDCVAALDIFRRMESEGLEPNLVTWTSLLSSHARSGLSLETLKLFTLMRKKGIGVNAEALAVILSVCPDLGAFHTGKAIHCHVIKDGFEDYSFVKHSLISLYGKSGNVIEAQILFEKIENKNTVSWNALITSYADAGLCDEAFEVFSQEGRRVFERIEGKDMISWNSIIKGHGMHGLGVEALQMFDRMITSGHRPDGITFIAILSACSHAGLVSQGRLLFDKMVSKYRIEPRMEHYACTVDLLGRSGLLEEASEVVKNMPMEPNSCVLGALLNSCRMHKNTAFAENVASRMFGLVSESSWSYTLMSNIYAGSGKWEDSARERVSARSKGLKKAVGQSWIEVKKKVCKFVAGDCLEEKDSDEIFQVLKGLTIQMEDISDDDDIMFGKSMKLKY
ncbi:unnamed protein product [Linum tenue]|uniref:Pentatricopeptide repeat-containing protein n=6 Tax=Linum tenue TaxID=586396 RepID=A0AAV0HDT0_9ROSI|nr:unnamed protein product [Linum tenue]